MFKRTIIAPAGKFSIKAMMIPQRTAPTAKPTAAISVSGNSWTSEEQ